MKQSFETKDLVLHAGYIRNARSILEEFDEEVHDDLGEILEEEVAELEGWRGGVYCSAFGPDNWYNKKEYEWFASFNLTCLGGDRPHSWLLSAAKEHDCWLTIMLALSPDLSRQRQILLKMEKALDESEEELQGVRVRISSRVPGARRLMIGVRRVPLEAFARADADWKELLRPPLHEAVLKAVKVREIINDFVLDCIG